MATKAAQQNTVSSKLIGRWDQVAQKLTTLADEFPATKVDYKPADGMRTVGEILRHVAFWNQYVADSLVERKADDTANELPKDRFSTKAQILNALKHSSADVLKALHDKSSDLSPEMSEMLVAFIEHNCEHYGQLAVYARLNGIIPPASRG